MKSPLGILFFLFLFGVIVFPSWGCGGEASVPELVKLREAYRKAVHEARTPVAMSYIEALGRLQDSLIKKGNLQEATVILEERTRLKDTVDSGALFAVKEKIQEAALNSVSTAQEENASPMTEGSYSLEGTTWSWSDPKGVVFFKADGKAEFEMAGGVPFRPVFTWERKADREFVVIDSSKQGRRFRLRIFPDGVTGSTVRDDSNALGEIELLSPR